MTVTVNPLALACALLAWTCFGLVCALVVEYDRARDGGIGLVLRAIVVGLFWPVVFVLWLVED